MLRSPSHCRVVCTGAPQASPALEYVRLLRGAFLDARVADLYNSVPLPAAMVRSAEAATAAKAAVPAPAATAAESTPVPVVDALVDAAAQVATAPGATEPAQGPAAAIGAVQGLAAASVERATAEQVCDMQAAAGGARSERGAAEANCELPMPTALHGVDATGGESAPATAAAPPAATAGAAAGAGVAADDDVAATAAAPAAATEAARAAVSSGRHHHHQRYLQLESAAVAVDARAARSGAEAEGRAWAALDAALAEVRWSEQYGWHVWMACMDGMCGWHVWMACMRIRLVACTWGGSVGVWMACGGCAAGMPLT